jgi:hypothetical protein
MPSHSAKIANSTHHTVAAPMTGHFIIAKIGSRIVLQGTPPIDHAFDGNTFCRG